MREKTIAAYVMDRNVPWLLASDLMRLDILYYAFSLVKDGKPGLYNLRNTELLKKIRLINPDLKVIVSIGGWGAGGFSEAAFTEEGREIFAQAALDMVREHDFDGIDMDWEYPCISSAKIASHPNDKQNFTYLLQNMRDKLDAYGQTINRKMYLTAAVGASASCVRGMEPEKISKILDYINLMTYAMRTGDTSPAGHHANLYAQTGDENGTSGDKCVHLYLEAGVPIEKMVLGAAFYGRMWINTQGLNHRSEKGSSKSYTDIIYLCLPEGSGYKRYWDEQAKAPYLYNGADFISYEDEETIALKCKYVTEHNMAGIMFWEYGQDRTRRLMDVMTDPANWQ